MDPISIEKKTFGHNRKERVLWVVLLQTMKNGFTKATLNDMDKAEELGPLMPKWNIHSLKVISSIW